MSHVRPNLDKTKTGLLLIDIQEKVWAAVEQRDELLNGLLKLVKGMQILQIPIFLSEQNPKGLGETLGVLQMMLGEAYQPLLKSHFSCLDETQVYETLSSLPIQQWILAGIESHICVLQTAKGLLRLGKQVVVPNDAIAARSIFDYSTSIAEMRDEGVRITSVETLLFELLGDSKAGEFKQINQLIKTRCCNE